MEGFEPSIELPRWRFSKPLPSTTQPHFQCGLEYSTARIVAPKSRRGIVCPLIDNGFGMKSFKTIEQYFKEVIYGGIDGIVTTFAVVAGFAGAALSADLTMQLSFAIVLLFGLANLFADAASMGLGNFLSVRSEQAMYHTARERERALLQSKPEAERSATIQLLQAKGFTDADATTLADIYQHNESYWLDFMMMHEHELADPRGENPVYTGLATFISFMIFGAIPLLPFMLMEEGSVAFIFPLSVVCPFSALVLLGLLKWKVIGDNFVASLTEVILVGGTAATLAYLVGVVFGA
jgi:vacuolar iron transporter family protein